MAGAPSPPPPVLRVRVEGVAPGCALRELAFEVHAGRCLWLQGESGAGKTLLCHDILGLSPAPGVRTTVEWAPALRPSERAGMLFQQGVLVDSLTVEENLTLALRNSHTTEAVTPRAIEQALERVGLKKQDGRKMPNELSGGMLQRATLAQILAQDKHLIVLDEPFTGLDPDTATRIAQLLVALKKEGTAFLLISHQRQYAELLSDSAIVVTPYNTRAAALRPARASRISLSVRTLTKASDYLVFSMPLIVFAFVAAGFAISMLFADLLLRVRVAEQILEVVETEFAAAEGAEDEPSMLAMFLPILKLKIVDVVDKYAPGVKAMLFGLGLSKLFVLELGPLLTALLLAGRIGGSYAGEVGTMQATNQNRLLQTLGVDPRRWTLVPATIAAAVAAPVLTLLGALIALATGAITAGLYGIGDQEAFWEHVRDSVFPEAEPWLTYPPVVLLYRSLGFMAITLLVAEVCGRYNRLLQPRDVPFVITSAVVLSGLLIIVADWGFSRVLINAAPSS